LPYIDAASLYYQILTLLLTFPLEMSIKNSNKPFDTPYIPYIPLRASLGIHPFRMSPHNAQQILTFAKQTFGLSGTTKTLFLMQSKGRAFGYGAGADILPGC